MLGTVLKLCVTARFFEKKYYPKNGGSVPKIGFCEYIEKFGD